MKNNLKGQGQIPCKADIPAIDDLFIHIYILLKTFVNKI